MKHILYISILIINISCTKAVQPALIESSPATDIYHGQEIVDPYRNLENLKDSTVVNWLKKQGEYAFSTLEKIPGRQNLINELMSYEQKDSINYGFLRFTARGQYFYSRTDDLDKNTYKLYYRESEKSQEIQLFDPSNFNDKGYKYSYIKPDWNGTKIAIGLSKKGEEISKIIVIDVKTKEVLPQVIENSVTSLGGITWLSDNSGFIYLHCPINDPTDSNYWMNMRSIVYKLGADPKKLVDIFSKQNNPELKLQSADFPLVYNYDSADGYLFAVVGGSASSYDIYYKKDENLLDKTKPWKTLCKKTDKVKKVRVDQNNNLIFLNSKDASNFRICSTKMSNPDFENPEILVSEKKDRVITNFVLATDGLYFSTKKNGLNSRLYKLTNNEETKIILPKPFGDISLQSRSNKQNFLRVSGGGFITPVTNYIYNLDTKKFSIESIAPVEEYPEFDNILVDNIEIPSHDGIMVPITIIRDKNVKKDTNNPTLLTGYGAYGSPGSAPFSTNMLTWVAQGGILVYAHVRGGGQKGDTWHKAGYKTTKPNTWKDMIATTEYMINEGYTSPSKTAIWGSSAGGICVGKAMTERPDLYQAVMLTSPALNMLRCEIQPNGQNSIKEFGTVAIKEEFEALLEMDSYHSIKKGMKYPATYITGGMKDGRVVIWDPAKFVAKLQAYNTTDNPILFGVKFDEGHASSDASKKEIYEFYANGFAFALWQMGYEKYQPE